MSDPGRRERVVAWIWGEHPLPPAPDGHLTITVSVSNLTRFVESEVARDRGDRDAVWCAAIIPEGSPLIQRVTERVNNPKFVAEVARIRAAVREEG